MLLKRQYAFEKIVQGMDCIIASTESLQQLYMTCSKQIVEFQNRNLGPDLHRDIAMIPLEVERLKTEVNGALERSRIDLGISTGRLSTIQAEIAQNRAITEREQVNYQKRAAAARESASSRRTSGILAGVLSLGLFLPYAIVALVDANDDENMAAQYAATANRYGNEVLNLKLSCISIESSIDSLLRANTSLENEEMGLSSAIQSQKQELSLLTNRMQDLELELEKVATGLSSDIKDLENSVKALELDSKGLRNDTQRVKISVSEWRDRFIRYRDASKFALPNHLFIYIDPDKLQTQFLKMVSILSVAAVILSATTAVQSAAVPKIFDDLDKRSPNDVGPLASGSSAAIVGRRHFIHDGVKLVRTADPVTDPHAAELHKRYSSKLSFSICNSWGITICGTCWYHEVSFDTAVCLPITQGSFYVFREMTNASARIFKDVSDCTGSGYPVPGCTNNYSGCNTFSGAGYNTKSVLAVVGCTP
ncbi:hypothetical protein H072_9125 [Dactylellina haptotyla CBS 200.50]|uniref:Uncharacterized protein n=1 Tax=Dactylellina haptotyla (strain CBS 200.50) TaxID=1284197 RepID=S8BPP9_DACHA|nr:hypothetical protein H072_9125 [Dactylellina haptotyla CBS 200.50]